MGIYTDKQNKKSSHITFTGLLRSQLRLLETESSYGSPMERKNTFKVHLSRELGLSLGIWGGSPLGEQEQTSFSFYQSLPQQPKVN